VLGLGEIPVRAENGRSIAGPLRHFKQKIHDVTSGSGQRIIA